MIRDQEQNDINTCPTPCRLYTTCSDCLEHGDCRWSTQLDECISASYQPIYCSGGVCGLVLQTDDRQFCPEPCSSFTQCSKCLTHAHCGWCAEAGTSGAGICTEGSSDRPMSGTCDDVYREAREELLVSLMLCYIFVVLWMDFKALKNNPNDGLKFG